MVRVVSFVAGLDLLKEVAELELIQLEMANQASPLVQVKRQHGQRRPRGGIRKSKDIKLPVVLRILPWHKACFAWQVSEDMWNAYAPCCHRDCDCKGKDVRMPLVSCIPQRYIGSLFDRSRLY